MTTPDPLELAREIQEHHGKYEDGEQWVPTCESCGGVPHPCDAYQAAEELERAVGEMDATIMRAVDSQVAALAGDLKQQIARAEALAGEVEGLKGANRMDAGTRYAALVAAEASLEASLLRERGLREALDHIQTVAGLNSRPGVSAWTMLTGLEGIEKVARAALTPPAPTTGGSDGK